MPIRCQGYGHPTRNMWVLIKGSKGFRARDFEVLPDGFSGVGGVSGAYGLLSAEVYCDCLFTIINPEKSVRLSAGEQRGVDPHPVIVV